jgi:hypothetical protein
MHIQHRKQSNLVSELRVQRGGSKARELTDDVKHKGNKPMVASKDGKVGVDEDDVLEVVNDGFAVEEVVGHGKEIPTNRKESRPRRDQRHCERAEWVEERVGGEVREGIPVERLGPSVTL